MRLASGIRLSVALLLAGIATPLIAQTTPTPAATSSPAATPAADLYSVPDNAEHWLIISSAGQHGTSARWTDPQGRHLYRESMNLRGQIFEQDATIDRAPDGTLRSVSIRGFTPTGPATETFTLNNGRAIWTSPVDHGDVAATAEYTTNGGPFLLNAELVERLLAAPGHSLALLPTGTAHLNPLATATIGTGAHAHEIQLMTITGLGLQPMPVWVDGQHFFGFIGGVALLPAAHTGELAHLTQVQNEALATLNPAFVQRFGQMPTTPVAFVDVRTFDSLQGRWLDHQTVVANGRFITAAGPAASTAVPANAHRIDGAGRTLVPGLWDSHMHFGDDLNGPMLLSIGVTSARDPGADMEPAIARRQRAATGQLLAPTLFPSILIDGAGPLAAQGGVTVNSAEETIAAVDRAHDAGFHAIKFYTSMHPDWLRAGITEAHRLGMHVHGHVPATMRAMDAIDAGYDEITHINFIAMQAMPDSVVNVSNGIARLLGPGRYARDIDLNAPPITTLITRMANNGIVSDPTLVAFEGLLADTPGEPTRAYRAFLGTLPPLMQRGLLNSGFAPEAGQTREGYRASFDKLVQLVGAMQRAGVPIVAGTDGSGLELVHELELYVSAGMTPAEALQAATIRPARLVGADSATGSITVGKEADLLLVDGDPSRNIGDLRHTLWVMTDGILINEDDLRAAVGFSGRPQ